jgi:hypothetical protein
VVDGKAVGGRTLPPGSANACYRVSGDGKASFDHVGITEKGLARIADDPARAIAQLILERDNLEIDMHDAEEIMARSLKCAATQDCEACDIMGEPIAEAQAYLEQHGWKDGKPPEQLREFVTKHREQLAEARKARDALTVEVGELQEDSRATKMFIAKLSWQLDLPKASHSPAVDYFDAITKLKQALSDRIEEASKHWQSFKEELDRRLEAEAAVTLLAEHFSFESEITGAEGFCDDCHRNEECGPGHIDSEPCEGFLGAEDLYKKFAPVRKVLERMKA